MREYCLAAMFAGLAGLSGPGATGVVQGRSDPATRATTPLQGHWKFVAIEQQGKKIGGAEMEVHAVWLGRLVVHGNRVDLAWGKKVSPYATFAVNPAANPPAIDLTVPNGPHGTQAVLGIYSLQGDELRVCFADEGAARRPTEFTAAAGSKQVVYHFRRMSAAEVDRFDLSVEQAKRFTGEWSATALRVGRHEATPEQLKGLNVLINSGFGQGLTFRQDRNVLGSAAYRMDPMAFNRIDLILSERLVLGPGRELPAGHYRGTYSARRPGRLHLYLYRVDESGRSSPSGTEVPSITLELRHTEAYGNRTH